MACNQNGRGNIQECLVLPKINEVLKRSDISLLGVCQRETGGNKIGQWTKPKNKNQNKTKNPKQNKLILDFSP